MRCGNTLHCLKLMVPFFLLGAVGQLLEHNCKSYEDEGIVHCCAKAELVALSMKLVSFQSSLL